VGRARLTTPRSNSTWALLRRTFSLGLEFIETNLDADNWFVQIETFDPHEPFFSQEEFKDLYPHDWDGPEFDWPPYREIQPELNTPVIFLDELIKRQVQMVDDAIGDVHECTSSSSS
jgi:hypothetical protein